MQTAGEEISKSDSTATSGRAKPHRLQPSGGALRKELEEARHHWCGGLDEDSQLGDVTERHSLRGSSGQATAGTVVRREQLTGWRALPRRSEGRRSHTATQRKKAQSRVFWRACAGERTTSGGTSCTTLSSSFMTPGSTISRKSVNTASQSDRRFTGMIPWKSGVAAQSATKRATCR